MSGTLRTLVIGTALTAASDAVVRTGAAMARAAGASPWLVHAYGPPAFLAELDARDGRWIEEMANELHAELTQQAERSGLAVLAGFAPDRLRLEMGSPPWEIIDLAREVRADLIVIGATEGGVLHRIFLGSTAHAVVRKASCPVLLVRDESAFPPRRVEIPVDLSPVSADACRRGLEILAAIGVPVDETEALVVLNPLEVGGSVHFAPEQVTRFASGELRRFLAANSPAEVPRLALVRTGTAREEILGAIRERRVDLAILGTHGRSGLERLTLGSVTAEVMHQSRCNLLIIPPGAGARREAEAGSGVAFAATERSILSDPMPVLAGRS